ncbi:MAG TPA: hypothetical protein VNW46_03135 [Gemmatimonadaceae bacterium]|jgi:hypothetical protein|nr:hypothetical protein [Gemmatimonadaceae bacterium]
MHLLAVSSREVAFYLIYLALPAAGVGVFWFLRSRMRQAGVDRRLIWLLFLCFFYYGGLAQVILTVLFWEWSGLASLGVLAIIFAAIGLPFGAAYLTRRLPAQPYKRPVLGAALLFPVAVGVLYLVTAKA